jgi:3D (Asp-Asp-Asp) domain-containing protein
MIQVNKYIKMTVAVIAFSIAIFVTIGLVDQKENLEETVDKQQQMIYDKEKELDDMRVELQRINDLLYIEQQEKQKNMEVKQEEEKSEHGEAAVFEITHYTHTGNNTASGVYPVAGRTVACNSLPIGTIVEINGQDFVVEDRGGMGGNVIDIFVDSESEAIQKGRYTTTVYVKG